MLTRHPQVAKQATVPAARLPERVVFARTPLRRLQQHQQLADVRCASSYGGGDPGQPVSEVMMFYCMHASVVFNTHLHEYCFRLWLVFLAAARLQGWL